VAITGTGFTGATAVKFNGTSAAFTVNSATSITATVPAGATTGKVSVTTGAGTGTSTSDFTVTAATTYSISGHIATGGGTAISGVSVTRTGSATPVTTNATGDYTFTGLAAGTYTITPSLAGYLFSPVNKSVTITNANATGQNFTGTPAPTVTGFSPTSGPTGTSVVFTGTNLTGATVVKFNTTNATAFTVNSATQITASVPAGATTGKISVTTAGGTASSAANFTVTTSTPPAFADNFGNAQFITGVAGTLTGSNTTATAEVSEPAHAGSDAAASVWVKWTAPTSGVFTFSTSGSDFDTVMGIYTGGTLATLTDVGSNDDENYPTITTSRVDLAATAGVTYYIAVDGFNDGVDVAVGNVNLTWSQ
jgi:hypothetical protein